MPKRQKLTRAQKIAQGGEPPVSRYAAKPPPYQPVEYRRPERLDFHQPRERRPYHGTFIRAHT